MVRWSRDSLYKHKHIQSEREKEGEERVSERRRASRWNMPFSWLPPEANCEAAFESVHAFIFFRLGWRKKKREITKMRKVIDQWTVQFVRSFLLSFLLFRGDGKTNEREEQEWFNAWLDNTKAQWTLMKPRRFLLIQSFSRLIDDSLHRLTVWIRNSRSAEFIMPHITFQCCYRTSAHLNAMRQKPEYSFSLCSRRWLQKKSAINLAMPQKRTDVNGHERDKARHVERGRA